MAVYVDDMYKFPIGQYRGMKMSHMFADTVDELLVMVDRIGVNRRWIQGHPTLSVGKARSASFIHFDIAFTKRELAVKAGAIEVLYRDLPRLVRELRAR